jgi:SAM-dependent methyltransferase
MGGVTSERWQDAQEAERGFWSTRAFGLGKFRRAAAGSIATAEWVLPHLSDAPQGDWLEVGIGPLGVGCLHFLGCPGELHTLDPIEPTPAEHWRLPEPCLALVRACQEGSVNHVGQAEHLEFAERTFTLVAMENMLDHVQDPAAVLSEARRVLRPGGLLFLAVDTFSVLGEIRFKLVSRRRWRETTFVRAHPHRFSSEDVLRLLAEAGFEVTAAETPGRVGALLGRHFRTRVLAR